MTKLRARNSIARNMCIQWYIMNPHCLGRNSLFIVPIRVVNTSRCLRLDIFALNAPINIRNHIRFWLDMEKICKIKLILISYLFCAYFRQQLKYSNNDWDHLRRSYLFRSHLYLGRRYMGQALAVKNYIKFSSIDWGQFEPNIWIAEHLVKGEGTRNENMYTIQYNWDKIDWDRFELDTD